MTVFQFKERFEVYTMADKKIHQYFTECNIDCDKDDIVTTCTLTAPYSNELLEYWTPIHTGIVVRGGVFDYEDLFIGVVRETMQNGYSIQITCKNAGRKFKEQMDNEFFEQFIKDQPCVDAVKSIFDRVGIKYHMDLTGIPDIESYVFDENGSVKFGEDTVDRVPDITTVVGGISKYNVDKKVSKYKETRTIEENAKILNAQQPSVNLYSTPAAFKTEIMDSVRDTKQDYKSVIKKDKVYYGEHTYEDIIKNFASSIDAHWYIVDTTVFFISFMVLFTQGKEATGQKFNTPRIEYWMIRDDSFELNVDQYGFYNTVWLEYNGGTVTAQYEDLVRIFGVVGIKYKDKGLDKTTAQLKAQAYLSAHVRDFGMTSKVSVLYSGKFTVASWVKIQNPQTLSETLMLITGLNVSYSSERDSWKGDLTLSYGPQNPDDPTVPELGSDIVGKGVVSGEQGSPGANGDVFPNSWPCINPDGQRNCSSLNLMSPKDRGAKVPEEIKNIANNNRTVQAVYDWIASNIAYRLYSDSIEGVADTVRTRDANCGDQANLGLAILWYLGFEVGWVWIAGHHYCRVKIGNQWHSFDTVRQCLGKKPHPQIILGGPCNSGARLGPKW